MKNCRRHFAQTFVCLAGVFFSASVFAGDGKTVLSSEETPSVAESAPQFRLSAEYRIEETYIGDSEVAREDVDHEFDESNTVVSFVFTPRVDIGILRLGAGYERYSFGFSDGSWPLPNTLQAANLVIGLDTQFSDSILVRIEAQPGIYGAGTDDLEWEDANVPFIIGGTYIYSPDLQFVLGIGVDVNRRYPVLPGGGVRWKIASQWVLNAVLPKPRLEFSPSTHFTIYAGAIIKDQTYRMSDGHGTAGGSPELDRAVLDYSEVRTGAGFDWKIAPAFILTLEGGYLAHRQFNFHRTEVRFHHESGAPYGTIALHGAF